MGEIEKKTDVFIHPSWETIINRAVFLNEEIICYPHRESYNGEARGHLTAVIKFLFGEDAYVTEDCINGYPSFIIKGATFELRNARTVNADWVYKKVEE